MTNYPEHGIPLMWENLTFGIKIIYLAFGFCHLELKMYFNNSIQNYLDDLAAKKPAPGGGSAAALTAASAASLMSMVINFTIGKPRFKDVEEKFKALGNTVEGFRNEFQSLIDEDVNAYSKLSKSMKEFGNDSAKIDAAYKEATDVPFKICTLSAECLKLCDELAEFGNKNLITDTAAAVILLEAAFFSAKFNVYINLKFIKDMDYIEKVHKVLMPLEDSIPKLKEEILHKCEETISK